MLRTSNRPVLPCLAHSSRNGDSRWSVYQLIWSGQLHTLKIGRRRLIRPAAYAACVNQLDNEAA
jgi:hypothetical protein